MLSVPASAKASSTSAVLMVSVVCLNGINWMPEASSVRSVVTFVSPSRPVKAMMYPPLPLSWTEQLEVTVVMPAEIELCTLTAVWKTGIAVVVFGPKTREKEPPFTSCPTVSS